MKFRKAYDFKKFTGLECGPGKTQSHHAEEVDINNIVARFNRTGELPNRADAPQYVDLLRAPKSLQEAQERLIQARQGFSNLPSKLREQFRNSPIEFYDRVSRRDPDALQSLEQFGLLVPKEEKKPKTESKQEVKETKAEPESKSGT